MAVTVKPIADTTPNSSTDLVKLVRDVFSDLEDQLNERAQIYVSTDGRVPTDLNRNDLLVVSYKGVISILIKNAKSFDKLNAGMLSGLLANGTNFKGVKSATVAPTLVDFPEVSDWGFYYNATANLFQLCFNFNNVLKRVTLT